MTRKLTAAELDRIALVHITGVATKSLTGHEPKKVSWTSLDDAPLHVSAIRHKLPAEKPSEMPEIMWWMAKWFEEQSAKSPTEDQIRYSRMMPYGEYLKTAHWAFVRTRALKKFGLKCAFCTATDDLQAHHRTYDRLGNEKEDDVVILCDECHGRHHGHLPKRRK